MEPLLYKAASGGSDAPAALFLPLQRAKPLSHRDLAFDVDDVRAVDQSVDDGVSNGSLAQLRVPHARTPGARIL